MIAASMIVSILLLQQPFLAAAAAFLCLPADTTLQCCSHLWLKQLCSSHFLAAASCSSSLFVFADIAIQCCCHLFPKQQLLWAAAAAICVCSSSLYGSANTFIQCCRISRSRQKGQLPQHKKSLLQQQNGKVVTIQQLLKAFMAVAFFKHLQPPIAVTENNNSCSSGSSTSSHLLLQQLRHQQPFFCCSSTWCYNGYSSSCMTKRVLFYQLGVNLVLLKCVQFQPKDTVFIIFSSTAGGQAPQTPLSPYLNPCKKVFVLLNIKIKLGRKGNTQREKRVLVKKSATRH